MIVFFKRPGSAPMKKLNPTWCFRELLEDSSSKRALQAQGKEVGILERH
jgi:hypothetical protein